jgi:DNA polymerase III sliding clamp (beta) subunit (PCNA family)
LTLRATGLNSDVTVSIPSAAAEFEATVDPNPLLQVLKMTDGIVEIKASKNGDLSVEVGRNKSNFKSVDVEFPKASVPPVEEGISLGQEMLVQTLSQVAFAASQGLKRPALQGVFFEFSKDGLRLAPAD